MPLEFIAIGSITAPITSILGDILNNPLIDLRFLIPVITLLFIVLSFRHSSKKSVIDSPPTLQQKREPFITPDDRLSSELKRIEQNDMEYYIRSFEHDVDKFKEYSRKLKLLKREYFRYDRWVLSQRPKKSQKGKRLQKEIFDEIVSLYADLKSLRLSVITTEDQQR